MSTRRKILDQLSRVGDSRPEAWIDRKPTEELKGSFISAFSKLGGTIFDQMNSSAFGICYVDQEVGLLPDLETTNDVWTAQTGVTRAQFAIAETGSLVFASGPENARLASLAPPRHVVLLSEDAIFATLSEAMEQMPPENAVIVTGPSRTADIEGVLVRGVHGPREIIVVFEPKTAKSGI